jgi:hypothetical protein
MQARLQLWHCAEVCVDVVFVLLWLVDWVGMREKVLCRTQRVAILFQLLAPASAGQHNAYFDACIPCMRVILECFLLCASVQVGVLVVYKCVDVCNFFIELVPIHHPRIC